MVMDLVIASFGPAGALGRWITAEIRVANDVTKRARLDGIRVNQRRLRRLLQTSRFIELISERGSRDELRASIDEFTRGNTEHSARLFTLIEAAITSRSAPARAAVAVGASIHERLDSIEGAVQGHASDDLLWDVRLSRLRPLLATTAREVRQVWPGMPTLIGLLDTGDRRAILDSWSRRLPAFLAAAPADVYCWLGDIATDLGAQSAARAYFDHALLAGAHPLGYWEVRRLWLDTDRLQDPSVVATDSGHPLVKARELELAGDVDGALGIIAVWSPSTTVESATRDLIMARAAFHANEFDRAVQLAMPLAKNFGSPAGTLIAARALIASETTSDGSPLHARDLSEALALLISARDAQRSWGYDSSAVVVLASTAARLLNDAARALSLTTAMPEGEATGAEAESPEVRATAALMLAENGVLDPARALSRDERVPPALSRQLKGVIAAEDGDSEGAIRYLSEALELVDEYDQKGQLAVRLATMGHLHPFVDAQSQAGNVDFAAELKLIAGAFADAPGGLDRLRAAAHSSARLSMVLSQLYEVRGETEKQLHALTAAAERLNDANLWLVAAGIQREAAEYRDAIQFAERARASAPPAWGAHERALMTLVESYAALRDWDQATPHAALLVQAMPENETAIWTLITCQHHSGELAAALGTWNTVARKRRPSSREHVAVWLALCQEYGETIASVDELVTVAAEFPEDEEIRRVIVGLVLLPAQGISPSPEDDVDNAQGAVDDADGDPNPRATLIGNYLRDFPDGPIRQFTLDLADGAVGLLDQIASVVGERADTSEFDSQVFAGAFPLGLISVTHSATYAEVVVSHASGVRHACGDPEQEKLAALTSLDRRVVLDTTAVLALTVLPESLRTLLIAPFTGLTVAAEQYRDAVRGLQAVSRFGHAGPAIGQWRGPIAQRARSAPVELSRSDRARAAALVGFMRPLPRDSRVPGFKVPDAEGAFEDDAWFAAAAVAADAAPLWSDDRALNAVAAHLGVGTFTTLGLVAALEQESRIGIDDARAIRVALLAERYMGIGFDPETYQQAVASHSDGCIDVASVIEHLDGSSADELVRWMLGQAPALVPNGRLLEMWISACVRFLTRISPDEASAASNLRLLAARIARSMWVVPHSFGFIDQGLIDGLDGRIVDPMAEEIDRAFRRLVRVDRGAATRWLFDLIAGVDPSRRPVYLGILLSP